MRKYVTILIDTCLSCPHSAMTDGIELDRWEGWVCRKMNNNKITQDTLSWTPIPNWCPLETGPERKYVKDDHDDNE